MATPVAAVVEAWNTVLYEKWRRYQHLVATPNMTPHGETALGRHPLPLGGRVLDVGCGSGTPLSRSPAASVCEAVRPVSIAPRTSSWPVAMLPRQRASATQTSSSPTSRPSHFTGPTTPCSPASAPCSSTFRARRCATCSGRWSRAASSPWWCGADARTTRGSTRLSSACGRWCRWWRRRPRPSSLAGRAPFRWPEPTR